jgi:hypothetical protein
MRWLFRAAAVASPRRRVTRNVQSLAFFVRRPCDSDCGMPPFPTPPNREADGLRPHGMAGRDGLQTVMGWESVMYIFLRDLVRRVLDAVPPQARAKGWRREVAVGLSGS